MYTEKIQKLENEILELKKYIKKDKKEIKKREKILSMVVDEEVETEIENTKKALETNDTEKIKEATEKLTKVFYEMSEQLYKNANPNAGAEGTEGVDPNAGNEANDNGNVYDADYKVEDDNK